MFQKTIGKLKTLSDGDLDTLYQLILEEKNDRPTYMSNLTHSPSQQCRSLQEAFANAWIH